MRTRTHLAVKYATTRGDLATMSDRLCVLSSSVTNDDGPATAAAAKPRVAEGARAADGASRDAAATTDGSAARMARVERKQPRQAILYGRRRCGVMWEDEGCRSQIVDGWCPSRWKIRALRGCNRARGTTDCGGRAE